MPTTIPVNNPSAERDMRPNGQGASDDLVEKTRGRLTEYFEDDAYKDRTDEVDIPRCIARVAANRRFSANEFLQAGEATKEDSGVLYTKNQEAEDALNEDWWIFVSKRAYKELQQKAALYDATKIRTRDETEKRQALDSVKQVTDPVVADSVRVRAAIEQSNLSKTTLRTSEHFAQKLNPKSLVVSELQLQPLRDEVRAMVTAEKPLFGIKTYPGKPVDPIEFLTTEYARYLPGSGANTLFLHDMTAIDESLRKALYNNKPASGELPIGTKSDLLDALLAEKFTDGPTTERRKDAGLRSRHRRSGT